MEGDRTRRRATEDGLPLLPHQNDDVNEEEPLFPLDKETMISVLQQVSAAALLCISMANVLTALNPKTDDESTNPNVLTILASLPYAFLPLGFAGLAAAVAAKTKHHLVGCGSGCLLGEFMYCFIIGGVVTAQSGANPWAVGVVTLMILVATVFAWSFMCSYPKFLCCWYADAKVQPCLTCGASRPAVDAAAEAMSGNGDQANVKAAAAVDDAELVVTNPMMAHLITVSSVIFSIVVITMFIYIVYLQFKIDGPLWEALVSCAAKSPLFIVPLYIVPMLRDAFVGIYAMGPADSIGSDLNSKLLAYENV